MVVVPLVAALFGGAVAGLGWEEGDGGEPTAWHVGDAATYTLHAGDRPLGEVRFLVDEPAWVTTDSGRYAWAVPLLIEWARGDERFVRTIWFEEEAVYETLQPGASDAMTWIDGSWSPTSICPFAPTGCQGSPWPADVSGDLGAWFGSAGTGTASHHLTRTSFERGGVEWTAQVGPFGLPPIAVVAAAEWGPEGDPDVRAAYRAFREQPEVADVLSTGYVALAWKHAGDGPLAGGAPTWQFVATDGTRTVERFVEPAPVPVLGPYRVVDRSETSVDPAPVPDKFPAGPPDALPHLQAVLDRFDALPRTLGADGEQRSWGYWTGCAPTSCVEAQTRIQVGYGTPDSGTFLRVDEDGRMVSFHERSPDPLLAALERPPPTRAQTPGWAWPDAATTASVGFASLLVGLLLYALPHVRLPFVGAFTRIRRDKVLDHPNRERILAVVEREPGIHVQAIADAISLSASTVRHHLRRLEEHGFVQLVAGGHRIGVWKGKAPVRPEQLWSGERREVLDAIRDGHRTMAALVEATGRSRPTLIHHIAAMEDAGVLSRVRDGRRIRLVLH